MNMGSPEYWARRDEKAAEILPKYPAQIRALQKKLDDGVVIYKSGHRVKNINPSGFTDVVVPLTDRQRERIVWNLKVLIFRSEHGYGGKGLGTTLPDHLSRKNPQNPSPAWDIFKSEE